MSDFMDIGLLIAAVIVAVFIGVAMGVSSVRDQAIDREFAIYCPLTGDFGWVGSPQEPIGDCNK